MPYAADNAATEILIAEYERAETRQREQQSAANRRDWIRIGAKAAAERTRAKLEAAKEFAAEEAERRAAEEAAERAWLTDPAVIAAPVTRPDAEVFAIVAVLSITEAARELGCHPRTLTQWLRAPGRAEAYREAMVDKGLIEGSSSTDPQWLAERLAREQYAPPQKSVEVRQAPPRPVIDVSAFTQEERDQFRALLVKAQQAALSRDSG